MRKPEVVFFGSGPVAAKSLELLLSDFDIVAVVTKPKPPHHRGSFPVIDAAGAHNLPLYTVTNQRELSALIAGKPFRTELAVLIDFGIIVSKDVIDYFPLGILNSHFSLLPDLRGADPISFAILSGQNKTGVSLMLLVEAMDEGPVIACGIHKLDGSETTPQLTLQLIQLSDALLKREIPSYLRGETKGIDQAELAALIPDYPAEATYSRKLSKDDGKLDFTKPAEVLEREIRAYLEWPRSYARLASVDVIFTSASVSNDRGEAGSISIKDKQLMVYCGKGALVIHELKPADKQAMKAGAFIAGYKNKLQIV